MTELVVIFALGFGLIMVILYLILIPTITTMIKMKFYEKVSGYITDKEIKNIETTDTGGKGSHYKYEFDYLGNTYQIDDKAFGYNTKLNVGDKVDIYIKKNNPTIYLYPNRVRDRYINLIIGLLGVAPLLFLIIGFCFNK